MLTEIRPPPSDAGRILKGVRQLQHASLAQPLDQYRIGGRPIVAKDRRAPGPGKPDRRFEVLERPRQAMERTQGVAARRTRVGGIGEREARLVIELGDDGVEARIPAAY